MSKESEPIEWGKDDKEDKQKKEDMVIPGEVVSRRVHKVQKEEVQREKDEYVSLDWDDVFPKKPKERLRWLYKAFEACKKGKVKPLPVFDIIAHRKFLDGLKGNAATDTLNLIRGNLDLFTPKQQKQLTSDNFELYRKYAPIAVLDSDDDETSAPPLPPPPKVVIEPVDKKKKRAAAEEARRRQQEEEEEAGDSDEDMDTKRQRILAKGVERRIDPNDGQAYTLAEFMEEYGGTADQPPDAWHNARHSAFIFKA